MEWFVHSMNKYVGVGVQTSFAEVYRALPRLEMHWQRSRGEHGQISEADAVMSAEQDGDDDQELFGARWVAGLSAGM